MGLITRAEPTKLPHSMVASLATSSTMHRLHACESEMTMQYKSPAHENEAEEREITHYWVFDRVVLAYAQSSGTPLCSWKTGHAPLLLG